MATTQKTQATTEVLTQSYESLPTPVMVTVSSMIVVSVGIFIVRWMFQQLTTQNEKRLVAMEQRLQQLWEDQQTIKINYVQREELIRVVGDIDKRIESLGDRSDKQFDKLFDRLDKLSSTTAR